MRVFLVTTALGIGALWYTGRPAPARVVTETGSATAGTRGAIHVHSDRSDGSGSIDTIADAAARAGLDFVVLTDHGDATRAPDEPRYVSGVLCIDAVEISTDQGHIVALGMPQAPYPLGGKARDVLDDIARLGGFAIAAHPDSPKPDLQWQDRDLPVDGIEWLNGDSEWRDEAFPSLTRVVLMYPWYGTAALATLLDRPVASIARWDALLRHRRVVAVAATDAHAKLGLRDRGEPYTGGSSLRVPSYENTFRLFSNVLPHVELSGDARTDAQAVVRAIREGRVYSMVDGVAGPGTLSFEAKSGAEFASVGGVVPASGGTLRLSATIQGPADAVITLFRDGQPVASSTGSGLSQEFEAVAAAYRVEVTLPESPGSPAVPWIVSNPIYVGRLAPARPPTAAPRLSSVAVRYGDGPATDWTVEHSPASLGAIDDIAAVNGGRQLALRYALGGAASSSAFTAFAMPAGPTLPAFDRILLKARANRPTRLSVQLRERGSGRRWARSVYLDEDPRDVTVLFDDMQVVGAEARLPVNGADIEAVLFVIDTVNARVGANGTVWIDEVRYAR